MRDGLFGRGWTLELRVVGMCYMEFSVASLGVSDVDLMRNLIIELMFIHSSSPQSSSNPPNPAHRLQTRQTPLQLQKMLTSKIHLPPPSTSTPEDIFSSSLHLLFPNDLNNQHGEPGTSLIYTSPRFGDIELRLADPKGEENRLLFSHYLWNAGVLVAEFLGGGGGDGWGEGWSVKGERVLELGAGR